MAKTKLTAQIHTVLAKEPAIVANNVVELVECFVDSLLGIGPSSFKKPNPVFDQSTQANFEHSDFSKIEENLAELTKIKDGF